MKIEIRPKHAVLFLFFLALGLYALFQARFLITGPRISIDTHTDGARLENELVTLGGRAENVAWLNLNGRQIFVDEEGYWSEKLLVSSGTSIMTLEARDRFGRETKKSIRLLLD